MNKKDIVLIKLRLFQIIILLLFMTACGPLEEVVDPDIPREEVLVSETLSSLKDREATYDFFSTRFSGNAEINRNNISLSGNIRIKKDSAIYISVAPFLGIEIARLLITPDTVKFINRAEGTYFSGDVRFINNMLNASLDYYMLQALLVGNDFDHFSSTSQEATYDENRVLLQSEARYPVRESHQPVMFEQSLWLDIDSYRIRENLLYEPITRRSLRARYSDFEEIQGEQVPTGVYLTFIEPDSRAELTLQYKRTSINEPESISFSIPEDYRPMND
ncbi:MAG: DUF4292 domain-containing protein [Bacteroidales bacterium]